LRAFRHVDFANRLECFSGERVGLETFLTEASVGHYFFQNGSAGRFFIIWVGPFSHFLTSFMLLLLFTDPSLPSEGFRFSISIYRESFESDRHPRLCQIADRAKASGNRSIRLKLRPANV